MDFPFWAYTFARPLDFACRLSPSFHAFAEACATETLGIHRESAVPVERIGYRCGFSDPSNFYKQFRRETGTVPSAWRKKTPQDS